MNFFIFILLSVLSYTKCDISKKKKAGMRQKGFGAKASENVCACTLALLGPHMHGCWKAGTVLEHAVLADDPNQSVNLSYLCLTVWVWRGAGMEPLKGFFTCLLCSLPILVLQMIYTRTRKKWLNYEWLILLCSSTCSQIRFFWGAGGGISISNDFH